MDTQKNTFYVASAMAIMKEQAIKAAIDHYFDGQSWDELTLEKIAGVNMLPDGTETFFIGDKPLVRFAALESKIDIEGESVKILFSQPTMKLY